MLNLLIVSFREVDKAKYGITNFNDTLDYARITSDLSDEEVLVKVESRYGIPAGVMTLDRYNISRFSDENIHKLIVKPKTD